MSAGPIISAGCATSSRRRRRRGARVRWHDGDFKTIDVPGAAATVVFGINDRGRMVGS
jgi:hypothetical protein